LPTSGNTSFILGRPVCIRITPVNTRNQRSHIRVLLRAVEVRRESASEMICLQDFHIPYTIRNPEML